MTKRDKKSRFEYVRLCVYARDAITKNDWKDTVRYLDSRCGGYFTNSKLEDSFRLNLSTKQCLSKDFTEVAAENGSTTLPLQGP
jgi:hypothetical protein